MLCSEEEIKLFKDCIEAWGIHNQLDLLCEECAELIIAVQKIANRGGKDFENLAEEMADVRLMIDEIEHTFNLHTETDFYREHKIRRVRAILSGTKIPKEKSHGKRGTKN